MKRMHMLLTAAALALASLPASAIKPKSFIAPNGESYKFDLEFGESGSLPDQFNTPEGLDVDAQGNVWVSDTNNHRIAKYDANGNFLFSFGGYGTGDGQFNYPKGLFVDTRRNHVWVSDTSNNRVQKFDLKGKFICKNSTLNAPRGLAVRDSNGNLYVSNTGAHSIVRMSNSCVSNGGWGGSGATDGLFNQPGGIAIDAAANVYVADYGNHRIQKFDAAGNFLAAMGIYGTGDSRYTASLNFYGPWGLDIDAFGDLFVTDYSSHRIQKFKTNGTSITLWGGSGTGRGQFNNPISVAIDASGRVFVLDRDNHRVQRFSPSSTDQSHLPVEQIGTNGTGSGQFSYPAGVAVNPDNGYLYVADNNNHRIEVFNANGVYQFAFGGYGTGDGQFNIANFIAIDPSSGAVYVTDQNNHRVQKFTENGLFVKKWGGTLSGTANGQFNQPQGIAVDPVTHDVYVADYGNHRVQRFTANGVFVQAIGNGTNWTGVALPPAFSNANSAFYYPSGVAVDADGNLFVTEYYGHRVQKFDSNGEFLLKWGATGAGAAKGQFNYPQGIAVDAKGNVFVADTSNNRIQRFLSDGRFVGAFGSSGSSAPVPAGLFSAPSGVALNGNEVFVADRSNHRIQVFERFGFKLTPTPASRTVTAGTNAKYDLAAKLDGGNTLATKVAFKVLSGLPADATASFSLAQVKPTNAGAVSVLTVTTTAATPAKTYKINVEAQGGGQTRVLTLTLVVQAPP